MKITDVRTVLLTGLCTSDPYLSEWEERVDVAKPLLNEISTRQLEQ